MRIESNIEEYIVEFQDLCKLFGIFGSELELVHAENIDDL